MTPIQQKVLNYTLAGHDAIGRAQTGTGKTAAFLISVINDLLNNPIKEQRYRGEARALILAPTRELALQIESDAKELTKFTDLHLVTLLGGVDFDKQKKQLDQNFVDIIVATPGRLIDFVEQKEVWLDQIEFLVIDEADRLLDMGFIPSVKRIVRFSPRKEQRQTLMFSATFSYDVLNLAQQWLFEPVTVEIEPEKKTNADVEQRVYMVANRDKYKLLQEILRDEPIEKVMIFANRRDQVRRLYDHLKKDGYKVVMLSGEIAQDKRLKMLDQFKNGKHNIMIATDVAGRGIHVDNVSHVINFTLPEQSDDYVHRIGRTGRAGRTGKAITLATYRERGKIRALEDYLETRLNVSEIEGLEPSPPPARPRREGGGGKRPGGRDGGRGGFGGGRRFEGESNFKRREGGRDDRPRRSFDDKPRGERPFGDDRPKRDFGDRPARRDFGDRPQRSFDDKPRGERSFGGAERPRREFNSDRPQRSFGDRPQSRSFGGEDRPRRSFDDKPRGERNFGGDRPRREGGFNDKPRFDSNDYNRGNRVDYKPRTGGFRAAGDRSERPAGGDRPRRSFDDKPRGERSFGGEDRPRRDFGGERRRKFQD